MDGEDRSEDIMKVLEQIVGLLDKNKDKLAKTLEDKNEFEKREFVEKSVNKFMEKKGIAPFDSKVHEEIIDKLADRLNPASTDSGAAAKKLFEDIAGSKD